MAENLDRAFDWDDVISKDGGDFTLLPKGTYPFTVKSFERGEYAGGQKLPACKMAILTIEVDGGQLGTATLTHRLFLHSRCEGLLCAFFVAIGLRKHGEPLHMPWAQVPGKRGMCEVGVRTWQSRNGQDMESNEITRFLEPDASAAPAPAAPAWSAGQF